MDSAATYTLCIVQNNLNVNLKVRVRDPIFNTSRLVTIT
jgi:hypothetical protein